MTWKKLNKARSKRTKSRHKLRTTRGSKKRVTSQSHLLMRWKRILDRLVRMKTRKTLDLMSKRSFQVLMSRRSFLDLTRRKRLTASHLKHLHRKIFQLETIFKTNLLHLKLIQKHSLSLSHYFSTKVMLMLAVKKKYWTNLKVILS